MDLKKFKNVCQFGAGKYTDRRQEAAANVAKTWGFDFWYNLFESRIYEFGGAYYESGTVYTRHAHYRKTIYKVEGQECGRAKFINFIGRLQAPAPVPVPVTVPAVAPASEPRRAACKQMELF
jgi:hypothetical protein